MANEEFRFTDGIKKVFLAGLGAVSIGADKSKEIMDILVKRGELTAEQAKSLSREMAEQNRPQMQNFAEKVVSVTTRTRDKAAEALKGRKIVIRGKEIDLSEVVGSLSLEQLEALKEGLGAGKQGEAAEETAEEPAETEEVTEPLEPAEAEESAENEEPAEQASDEGNKTTE